MKSSVARRLRPRAETEEDKRRRLQATAPSDQSPSENNEEERNKEHGPMDPEDPNKEHDEGEYESESEEEKKKDEDEGSNGEEKALRDDSTGDRAAERNDLISAYRDCERHRIAAILKSPEAKGREEAALAVALETSLPRDQAIAMLKMSPRVPKAGGINDRMSQNSVTNVGPADPVKERASREATALAITNAGRKARGEPLLQSLSAS